MPFPGEIPPSFRLYLYQGIGPLPDQLANPMGLTIWSNRLVKHLWPLIHDCVQLLPAPVFERSGEPVPGYHIVNVTKVLNCVDWEKSPRDRDSMGHFIMPSQACIDPSRTGGAPIFKWLNPNGDVDTGVSISYEFLKSLEMTGFTGLAAIPYGFFDYPEE